MTGFRRLWLAATVDAFGSWLLVMAVPLEVYRRTGSTASTGLALAIEALPAVLIGPWAGAAVDRWPRRRLLVLANLAAAAGVALMLARQVPPGGAHPANGPGFLYLALAVESVAVCFIQPAMSAVLPSVAPNLASANAQLMASTSAFRLLGPPAGTLLAAHGRFAVVVLVDVASYLVAAAIIAAIRFPAIGAAPAVRPPAAQLPAARTPAARSRAGLWGGLRFVVGSPMLRGLMVSTGIYWSANAALTVLLIPFATGRLHSGGEAVGYLIAGLGLGYLCGSTLSATLTDRYPVRTILTCAYAMVGLCFLVLFTTSVLPVALAAVTLSGVPGAVATVAVRRCLQTATPAGLLGRVSAVFLAGDAVAAVAGAVIAPAVVAMTGPTAAPVVLSTLVLASAVTAAGLPREVVTPGSGSGRRPE